MNAVFVIRSVRAMRTSVRSAAFAATLATSLAVPLQASAQPAGGTGRDAGHTGSSATMPHGDGMKGANDKMSPGPTTGNPDVDFAQAMRAHHQGAIEMAEKELKNGKDTSMRKLARDILNVQRKDIVRIDRFLAKQGSPAKKS